MGDEVQKLAGTVRVLLILIVAVVVGGPIAVCCGIGGLGVVGSEVAEDLERVKADVPEE